MRACVDGNSGLTECASIGIASEYLKGRIVEANLADLQNDEDQGYRKIKLRIDEIQSEEERACQDRA